MKTHLRTAAVTLLLILAGALLLLALTLLASVQLLIELARRVLRDRLSLRGNQLFRLGQRVRDADERLVAALDIVTERMRR